MSAVLVPPQQSSFRPSADLPSTRELFASGLKEWTYTGPIFLPVTSGSLPAAVMAEIVTSSGAITNAAEIEDAFSISENLVTVLDASSSVYATLGQRAKVNGKWDGQFAAEFLAKFCRDAPSQSLFNLIVEANTNLAHELRKAGFDLTNAGDLPGVSGAAARFGTETHEVCQWGDGIVVLGMSDNATFAFPSQSYREDVMERGVAANLLVKHDGNRGKMWGEFAPMLREFRREAVNNEAHPFGYGNLNGQEFALRFIREQTFPASQVKWMLLATDGIVPFEQTGSDRSIADYVGQHIRERGLKGLYAAAKQSELAAPKDQPFTAASEKTAVLIRF